nr:hypothetical protein FJN17_16770 [Bradyrhizobium symbiodeficiens]
MSVPKQIFDFLLHDGGAYCDACIQAQLNLPRRQQVQQVTATLALTNQFVRQKDACYRCSDERQIIYAKSRPRRIRTPSTST